MKKMQKMRLVLLSITKFDLLLIVVLSLVAGNYMVVHREPESAFELFKMPGYPIALLGSFLIALVVTICTCLFSIYIDINYPWADNLRRRMLLQLLLGTFAMVILANVLAGIYFWLRGHSIFDTAYYHEDFWQVVFFILFLNVIYSLQFAIKSLWQFLHPPKAAYEEVLEENCNSNHKLVLTFSFNEIAYIYHLDRLNWAVNFEGQRQATDFNLEDLMQVLTPLQFFRVQKGFIISKRSIKQVENASSRRLTVYLNTPLHEKLEVVEIGNEKINVVSVPQRQVKKFQVWLSSKNTLPIGDSD